MHQPSKLIAIVGGSGAGKSWLARHLQRAIGPAAVRLSLDDFYHDRSKLPPPMRAKINYDHPRAIDWLLLRGTLRACRTGKVMQVPAYNFATHTRMPDLRTINPGRVALVDGLWLLSQRSVREMFDFSIYLDCPTPLRLERRVARDVAERGRDTESVSRQFWESVAPMHDRHVAPQRTLADIVLWGPPSVSEVENLAETIRALIAEKKMQKRFSRTGIQRARPVAEPHMPWVRSVVTRPISPVLVHGT